MDDAKEPPKVPPQRTPLPKFAILALANLRLVDAMALNGFYAYGPFLVKFCLAEGASASEIVQWVGIIGSSYGIAQIIGGVLIGWLSDRFGRVSMILLSALTSIVFITLFGFTTNVWMLAVIKFMHGITNGIMGLTQVYISEITDDTNTAMATSILSSTWGAGGVIGPACGGLLAFPHTKYPNLIGEDSILAKFPALPPLLLTALMAFVSLFMIARLPETLPTAPQWCLPRNWYACIRKPTYGSLRATYANSRNPSTAQQQQQPKDKKRPPKLDKESLIHSNGEAPSARQLSVTTPHAGTIVTLEGDFPEIDGNQQEENGDTQNTPKRKNSNMWRDFRELLAVGPPVVITLFGFTLHTFSVIAQVELGAVWMSSKQTDGGLGFSIDQVSYALMACGITMLTCSWSFHPWAIKKIGPRTAFITAACVYSFFAFALPYLHDIQCAQSEHHCEQEDPITPTVWALMFFLQSAVRGMWGPMAFTSCFIMANNATTIHRGLLNGVMSSSLASARGFVPYPAAALMGWSLTNGLSWPFDYHCAWIVCAIGVLGSGLLGLAIPKSVNQRKSNAPAEELQSIELENETEKASGATDSG